MPRVESLVRSSATTRSSSPNVQTFFSSLWTILSNISNDPMGIQFQWRKSNTERLFHQALGVSERFRVRHPSNVRERLIPIASGRLGKSRSVDSRDPTARENQIHTFANQRFRPSRSRQQGTRSAITPSSSRRSIRFSYPLRLLGPISTGSRAGWKILSQVRLAFDVVVCDHALLPNTKTFNETTCPSIDNDSSSLASNLSKNEDHHGKCDARSLCKIYPFFLSLDRKSVV